jgi:hypothetical protein
MIICPFGARAGAREAVQLIDEGIGVILTCCALHKQTQQCGRIFNSLPQAFLLLTRKGMDCVTYTCRSANPFTNASDPARFPRA